MKRKKIIVMILVFVMVNTIMIVTSLGYFPQGSTIGSTYIFNDESGKKVLDSGKTESNLALNFMNAWNPEIETNYKKGLNGDKTQFESKKNDYQKKVTWFNSLLQAIKTKNCNLMNYPNSQVSAQSVEYWIKQLDKYQNAINGSWPSGSGGSSDSGNGSNGSSSGSRGIEYGNSSYSSEEQQELKVIQNPSEIFDEGSNFINAGSDQSNTIKTDSLYSGMNLLYSVLMGIGALLAVVVGIVLGIKLMFAASSDEKAEYKKDLIVFFVGCVIIFAAFGIWKLAVSIVSGF